MNKAAVCWEQPQAVSLSLLLVLNVLRSLSPALSLPGGLQWDPLCPLRVFPISQSAGGPQLFLQPWLCHRGPWPVLLQGCAQLQVKTDPYPPEALLRGSLALWLLWLRARAPGILSAVGQAVLAAEGRASWCHPGFGTSPLCPMGTQQYWGTGGV